LIGINARLLQEPLHLAIDEPPLGKGLSDSSIYAASSVGARPALSGLEHKGYVLTKGWGWRKPSASHKVTTEEADAIQYLKDEWDIAGLEP